MKKFIISSSLTCLALSGCGDSKTSTADIQPEKQEQVASAAHEPQKKFTKADWRAAFKASFLSSKEGKDDDGVSTYVACFDSQEAKRCERVFSGEYDAFKKIDHLEAGTSILLDVAHLTTFTKVYLAASECEPPAILVAPTFAEKGGWLFMNRASYMADGEVVLEKTFDHGDVKREVEGTRVFERGTWIASSSDIEGLRKIAASKTSTTRFTGESAYFTVDKKVQADTVKIIQHTIDAYDRLNDSFKKSGGPACS